MVSIFLTFQLIQRKINTEIEKATKSKPISEKDVKRITSTIIKDFYNEWKSKEYAQNFDDEEFLGSLKSLYKENIEEIKQEVFEKLPLDVENQLIGERCHSKSIKVYS